MSNSLTCVARARGNEWEAICLDFDLVVQGRSFDEVRSYLETAIVSYIQDAAAESEPARTRLLKRRAPWYVWFKWNWPFLKAKFSGRTDSGEAVRFPVTCPA